MKKEVGWEGQREEEESGCGSYKTRREIERGSGELQMELDLRLKEDSPTCRSSSATAPCLPAPSLR